MTEACPSSVSFPLSTHFLGSDGRTDPSTDTDQQESVRGDHPKHQAVLSMDMNTWLSLIEVFEIEDTIIRHRKGAVYSNVGSKGWYA